MRQKSMTSEKLSMSDFRYWWDLRIFIQSILGCSLVLIALLTWIEHVKLPEGYVFERLQPIEGAWGKESGSLRSTSSKVDRTSVSCSFPRILYGGGVSSCSHLKIPYGAKVTVVHVRIPMLDRTLYDSSTYVQRLSTNSAVYIDRTDSEIGATWLRMAWHEAIRMVVDVLIFSYFVQILLFRKAFRSQ